MVGVVQPVAFARGAVRRGSVPGDRIGLRVEQRRDVRGGAREDHESAAEAVDHARPGEAAERVIDLDGTPSGLANKFGYRPRPRGGLEKERTKDQPIYLTGIGLETGCGRVRARAWAVRGSLLWSADHEPGP